MIIKMASAAKLTLLYRGSRDGFLSSDFHEKCDGKTNTIALVKPKGKIINERRVISNLIFFDL